MFTVADSHNNRNIRDLFIYPIHNTDQIKHIDNSPIKHIQMTYSSGY